MSVLAPRANAIVASMDGSMKASARATLEPKARSVSAISAADATSIAIAEGRRADMSDSPNTEKAAAAPQ